MSDQRAWHPIHLKAIRQTFGFHDMYPNYNLLLKDTRVIHEVKYVHRDWSDITLCGVETKELRVRTGPRQDDDNFECTQQPVNCLLCFVLHKEP